MEVKRLTGLRKRQQIQKANHSMFIWLIAGSVVVAFCAVGIQFILKQAMFNGKIITAKTEARNTLEKNIKNADTLKNEVNLLIANQDLASIKGRETDTTLQVVLDALPTEDDPTAFAASLQNSILNRSGIGIEALSTGTGSSAVATVSATGTAPAAAASVAALETPFQTSLVGNFDQIKTTLRDLERVIRPICINGFELQGSGDNLQLRIEGKTYYVPAKSVNITTKKVDP